MQFDKTPHQAQHLLPVCDLHRTHAVPVDGYVESKLGPNKFDYRPSQHEAPTLHINWNQFGLVARTESMSDEEEHTKSGGEEEEATTDLSNRCVDW